jgi:hypothetical protein
MNVFALLEDNPNYYEKWIKKGRYTNGKSQLEVLKFMQMELWEVEVLVCSAIITINRIGKVFF